MRYLLIATLLLSGCAGSLTHPTKGDVEYQQDLRDCEQVAQQRLSEMENRMLRALYHHEYEYDYTQQCMVEQKGWGK